MKTNPAFLYVIYCLICYRLTRLITEDGIMEWFRDWVKGHIETELVQKDGWGQVVDRKIGPSPKVNKVWIEFYELVTCPWCVSFWFGMAIAIYFYRDKGWLMMVGYALALSAFSGVMAEKV